MLTGGTRDIGCADCRGARGAHAPSRRKWSGLVEQQDAFDPTIVNRLVSAAAGV
jgi:hypothetical protein